MGLSHLTLRRGARRHLILKASSEAQGKNRQLVGPFLQHASSSLRNGLRRRPTIAMEWMGKHALMIYVLVACNILPMFIRGFYWRDPNNSLLKVIGIGA
ncbi:hypothetical protein ZEAMMB73_Zm00001d016662 [Zea mays]|uniref:Uncharacterized protein n=1 Tax=Zea mays TaxID=4577 RepID=A0A1D6H9K0_MAIZE|nr:hypothetical protein ZEAMMB73_Zm00001d016662 [Zea mays]AQK71384.1 hypothetical protein ZEAMMB73_Zm00001d016662 [Zea mays]AQK71385.1 hypothetical protein ZEAMMB73_Zm00001d016662 [Zea mays]